MKHGYGSDTEEDDLQSAKRRRSASDEDIEVLAEAIRTKSYREFAVFEQYIDISYASTFNEGEIIPVMDEQNEPQLYKVHRLKTVHPGLVSLVLIPQGESGDVKILFQGTTSLQAWQRNVTASGGAGYNSFMKEKDVLIAELIAILKTLPLEMRRRLRILGHSLGGCDAQNMMVEVMAEIDRNTPILADIRDLQICVFNSGGVPKQVAERSEVLAVKLKARGISISPYFLLAGGDLVQQEGDAMILANLAPETGTLLLAKARTTHENTWTSPRNLSQAIKAGLGTLSVHNTRYFNSDPLHKIDITIYSNQTPSHRQIITRELTCKIANSHPVLNTLVEATKMGIAESGITIDTVCKTVKDRCLRWATKSEPKAITVEQTKTPPKTGFRK